jgi:hypothetical protein
MLDSGGAVADTNNTSTMLGDELAALDPAGRRELAAALRSVAETLAEVRDGQTTAQVLAYSRTCSTRLTVWTCADGR